jgi:RimJ/RimL family protein N-acetyltransferase
MPGLKGAEPTVKQRHINYECTIATFRPCQVHLVRWLDWEQDYGLAQAVWNARDISLTRDSWREARESGYRYCAVIECDTIIAMAAVWCYSEQAWEVAAVWTRPEARRQGYARSVVSFVTAFILEMGKHATCSTDGGNVAMQRTAERIGFYQAARAMRAHNHELSAGIPGSGDSANDV